MLNNDRGGKKNGREWARVEGDVNWKMKRNERRESEKVDSLVRDIGGGGGGEIEGY